MVLELVPLAAALLVVGVVALARVSRPIDRRLTRLAYYLFDGGEVAVDVRREQLLRSAAIGTPYRVYATKSRLYGVIAAVTGSVIGVYAAAAILSTLSVGDLTFPGAETLATLPETLRSDDVKRFAVYLFSAFSIGGLAGTIVYALRWQLPAMRASTRRRQIDANLPRIVAFVYALSRGGMAFPEVMRALSRNRGVFGAGAEDVGVGVREIDLFGTDVVTTVRTISNRTPSEQFQRFTENLTNVLQSGSSLTVFLEEQYERYRDRAEEQQEEILELIATTAEVYVTVVVAGMLFLITILLVIGLTSGDTLTLIRIITYLLLPVTNLAFVAHLSDVTRPLRASREREVDVEFESVQPESVADLTDGPATQADGGYVDPRSVANRQRLRAYQRLERIRSWLGNPVTALVETPELILLATVPLAMLYVGVWMPTVLDGGFDLQRFDDVLIQATLFVMATFAVVYEISKRRLRRLEESIPDLLERLASLNEAGVSIVSSFDRVRRADAGTLDEEVQHVWRDVHWGATIEQALYRFERRVETPAVTRVVTLITSAMAASNEIAPVLRIAAEQARADQRLRRQRRQEMFTYLVVVYIATVVFLVVILAIDTVFIPNLPTPQEMSAAAGATAGATTATPLGFAGVPAERIEQYRVVFFHAALVQAALSGLVGGQMSGGTVKDGVKHATIMLGITYIVFLFV